MILCCGEAVIDMIPRQGEANVHEACPGGAALNSAVALARLGEPVGVLAGLSLDPFGQFLEAHLRSNAVELTYLVRSSRPSTLAFAHLGESGAQYSFYDIGSSGRMLQEEDLSKPGADVKALLFGGISLAVEPCGASFESYAESLGADCIVMMDANIRPALIEDEVAYRERLHRLFALADIVKLSEEDLEWLGGDVLTQLIAQTPLTLLTRGEQGATAWRREGEGFHVPVAHAEVADTVGAGDTFNAAFLSELRARGALQKEALKEISETTLQECLTFACKAARISVTRTGADSPWRSELE